MLHATNLRIPIVEVEGGSLTALAGFDGHQGVALVVEPRQFASLDDVLARAAERDEPPFILVLDSLEDPHNVGTLLRSAEAAGVHGVLFPTHRQAPLSPSAVKASAGAIEHLLLAPVDDLPAALSDLHTRGVRIAGADGDAPMTARQTDLRGPLAIVVGSEGQGLGPAVRRRADMFMRIPMKGAVGSLNAAVAGSILLFEALAQRDPNATPRVPLQLPDPRGGPAGPTKGRAAERSKDAAGDVAPSVVEAGEAAAAPTDHAALEPATGRKPRVRMGLSTEPAEPVASTEAESAEPAEPTESTEAVEPTDPAAPKRRGRKAAAELAAQGLAITAEPAAPKLRARKAPSPKPSKTSAEGAAPSPEDDLLPPDGAKKQTRKDPGPA